MRIAVSGTHRVGKTSLIEALSARLPDHEVIEEPYLVLEEEGYELAHPPTLEDFEAQLRRSCVMTGELAADALVDRCPLDFVAYLRSLEEDYEPDVDALREAMEELDLVVFVGVESPDRIAVPAGEDRRLRADVDARLRALVLEDSLGLSLHAIEVEGDLDARVAQVLAAIAVSARTS